MAAWPNEDNVHWCVAAQALVVVKRALSKYVTDEMKAFHDKLKRKVDRYYNERQLCPCNCENAECSEGYLDPKCTCQAHIIIVEEIISLHRQKRTLWKINFKNSSPSKWLKDPWEIAKIYMTEGVPNTCENSEETDAQNLLTLIKNYKGFDLAQRPRDLLHSVIDARNKVMHDPNQSFNQDKREELIEPMIDLVFALGDDRQAQRHELRQLRDTRLQIQAIE